MRDRCSEETVRVTVWRWTTETFYVANLENNTSRISWFGTTFLRLNLQISLWLDLMKNGSWNPPYCFLIAQIVHFISYSFQVMPLLQRDGLQTLEKALGECLNDKTRQRDRGLTSVLWFFVAWKGPFIMNYRRINPGRRSSPSLVHSSKVI